MADATRIVEACIAGDESGVVKLTLAMECLEEALAVRPDLRSKVEHMVIERLEDPQPERARLAAETRLALRLHRLARIDDDHYADQDFISCAEYQLFVDDRRAAGDYRQPDHWSETHFPPGSAQQPVLGVRPSDAEEFCRWLSECQGSEWSFQIPDRILDDPPFGHAGYWANTRGGVMLYGRSTAPLTIPAATLQSRLSEDRKAITAYSQALANGVVHDRPLARFLQLALDRARYLPPSLVLDREIISALDRDFAGTIASTLELPRNVDLDLARALDRDLDLVPDIGRYQARAITRCLLLGEILLSEKGSYDYQLKWYTRLLPRLRKTSSSLGIDDLLRMYYLLVIVEERIQGKLSAFEGIRIMKTRKAVDKDKSAS
jgi:hypothetical protein